MKADNSPIDEENRVNMIIAISSRYIYLLLFFKFISDLNFVRNYSKVVNCLQKI